MNGLLFFMGSLSWPVGGNLSTGEPRACPIALVSFCPSFSQLVWGLPTPPRSCKGYIHYPPLILSLSLTLFHMFRYIALLLNYRNASLFTIWSSKKQQAFNFRLDCKTHPPNTHTHTRTQHFYFPHTSRLTKKKKLFPKKKKIV